MPAGTLHTWIKRHIAVHVLVRQRVRSYLGRRTSLSSRFAKSDCLLVALVKRSDVVADFNYLVKRNAKTPGGCFAIWTRDPLAIAMKIGEADTTIRTADP